MAKPIFVLNGPNLNLLGKREPDVYGTATLDDVRKLTEARAQHHGFSIEFRQSNLEGELVGWVQEARDAASAVIINAAGYTHTSVALLDSLQAAELPVVEVHLSNIFRRDSFRQHSYISLGANGVICGFGAKGYELAVDALADIIKSQDS